MATNKLYVGNLKYSTTNDQIRDLFSSYGEVVNVNVLEGKGFGFVEMATADAAVKAQEALDGQDFQGRVLRVNEARPPRRDGDRGDRGDRSDRGGRGGRGPSNRF